MKILSIISSTFLFASFAFGQNLTCDLKEYKAEDGLKAAFTSGILEFTWQGEHNQQLRVSFSIRDGSPVIHELAARKSGGNWVVLGHDLSPEYEVTSGKRRLSEQQMAPLRKLKIAFTPEVVERQENDPIYGKVFHTSTPADELRLLNEQDGLMWQTHPRTKGSAGYPDATKDWEHFKSERFLGGSYQSLPVDQSEKRICEKRCFGLLDDMNNWAGAKYMIAEGDTYMKYPDDETYPELLVNYVKLDQAPRFDQEWTPLLRKLRAGDFFVTSGEVLFHNWGIEGSGPHRTMMADIEWTFPLEFVERVWGDGTTTNRQIISATDMAPFGKHQFRIPFDVKGKKWVRFAVWDSAGNGAFTQPVHLNQ